MAKRTIRRSVRKNKTIRKVMRGCNRRLRRRHSRAKVGGQQKIEAAQYAGASPQANQNLAGGTAAFLEAQQMARNSPPAPPAPIQSNMVGMKGGARTRHHRRRLRYKKSMARKSRRA